MSEQKWIRRHCHIEIKQVLAYSDRKLNEMFRGNPEEIRDALIAELRTGHDYFAFGECDNRKPDGSCAGHECESEGKAQ